MYVLSCSMAEMFEIKSSQLSIFKSQVRSAVKLISRQAVS